MLETCPLRPITPGPRAVPRGRLEEAEGDDDVSRPLRPTVVDAPPALGPLGALALVSSAPRPSEVVVATWLQSPCGERADNDSDLLALCVLTDFSEVDHDTGLIADYLGVMTRRDSDDVTGADLGIAPVVHVDLHSSREAVPEVRDLTRVGLRYRFDVLGPTPAGFEGAKADGMTGDMHHLRLAVSLERTRLVRGLE